MRLELGRNGLFGSVQVGWMRWVLEDKSPFILWNHVWKDGATLSVLAYALVFVRGLAVCI